MMRNRIDLIKNEKIKYILNSIDRYFHKGDILNLD